MGAPLCDFEGAKWLVFNPNVPPLVYYSHLPILIISVILAFFILFKDKKALPNRILFVTLISFSSWVFLDSIFWASNRSDVIMLVWSLILLFEPLIYIGCFYLLYVLITKRDLPSVVKTFFFIICLPLIIFVPTKYGLSGFDIYSCLSVEGPIALYYTYFVEILTTAIIVVYSLYKIRKTSGQRKEIIFLLSGVVLFLGSFAWGNITGSFTENWQLGQFGLFGMPIFAGFLAYSIVKYKTFNTKLIGAQALVVSLWFALFAVLFVTTIENVRIIVFLTLILFTIIGILLIRSVLKEVQQREKIEKIEKELEVAYGIEKKAKEDTQRAYIVEKKANEELEMLDRYKNDFLRQTQHDLKNPLTVIMGYSDLLLSGNFGKMPNKGVDVVKRMQAVAQDKIRDVNNFLNVEQFKMGKGVVSLKPGVELMPILEEVTKGLVNQAEAEGIYLKFERPPALATGYGEAKENFVISADREKLKSALFNVVGNAVKYTKNGGVDVKVEKEANNVKIIISDTGIGIPKDKIKSIFGTQFERSKQAEKTASGTGVGLYLSAQIIKLHNGKVWAESRGEGMGSTFYIELPVG